MGMDMGAMARPLLNELKKKNVSFLTTTTATLMDGSKLYVKIGEMTLFVSADTVIWAGGSESVVDTELTMWLMDERMSYAVVGDAKKSAMAAQQSRMRMNCTHICTLHDKICVYCIFLRY